MIQGTNKIYWMFYRLDVLQAYCLMFPHDFVSLNAVMFPMAKMFQGFFFDYKTTNGIFFFWVALRNYQWVVFLQWKQYCYGSQCLTSRTDYFMNTWGKSSQIIIYPLSRVKCKVQDENLNNIHDASQSKSCKLHHNILYF